MILDLTADQQSTVDRIRDLASHQFAPRAAACDATASFPEQEFESLSQAGLLAPVVPGQYGGLGLSYSKDAFTLWMMTKELAKANLSLARCWEGHINCQVLLASMANESQQERWFKGIVQRGEKWAGWSGEPQSKTPGQKTRFGTTVQVVDGGYVVDGTKIFATSAHAAQWAILLVNPLGSGGARHAHGSAHEVLMLACDLSDSSISFDDRWWQPIGMKGTISYLVRFENTFIPSDHLIGYPGQYLLEEWQTRFTPQYGASFLGAAEAAYDYTLAHVKEQDRGHDPYVQHRMAQSLMNLETIHLWLHHAARLWEADKPNEAKQAGIRTRYLAEKLAMEVLEHCLKTCGARSLIQPSPLERIYRDLSFYVLHDSCDRVLASIGQEVLGQSFDRSFFHAPKVHQPAS